MFVTDGALRWGDVQRSDSLSPAAKLHGTAQLIRLGDCKHKETRNKKANEKCEVINDKLHSTKIAFLHLKLWVYKLRV